MYLVELNGLDFGIFGLGAYAIAFGKYSIVPHRKLDTREQ